RLRTYPFYVKERVLRLHGAAFRSRLGMVTNTPSSVYKPLHEYRILRVSNSLHLCELCTTLSVIERHIPLYMISSFTKRPACLEHHQIVRYVFFFACLSSWCLSRKGVAIPLNAKPGCPLL
ncbi:hypothetical protein BHM03_00033252, partial [Ensete ventricosum]